MADEEISQTQDSEEAKAAPVMPKFLPGELEPFDFSPEEFVELTDDAKNEVRALCANASKRDTAARRMEVEQSWEARLFKRGYQYLLPRRGGGWNLPGQGTGLGAQSQLNRANLLETNIYGAHCDILTSALVRDIPESRFEPFNPNYAPDITAADKAEEFKEIFARNNDLRSVHTQAADYMCTDGRVLFYTRMVVDGQRFGFEDPEEDNPLAPEDETTGAPDSPNVEEGQDEAQISNDSPVQSEEPQEQESEQEEVIPATPQRKARGREIVDVLGKLEHKVPINTRDIHEMDFVQAYWDVHESRAKARFPWVADKIKPGGQGVSEIELDRIARLNCALALPGSYVTGDSFNRDVTIQYNWLRPCSFMSCKKDAVKAELFEKFPDGMLVVYAGETLAFARNESMDDHLHILQSFPGSGQNRIALMSKVISLQKRLNNMVDLQYDFFIKTVPQKWMDSQAFNVEAIQTQSNVPGGIGGFQRQAGTPVSELIFIEPTPAHQPELPEFIGKFFTDFPEMLSGALPSLFGAESNTDTVGGISIQRDQALGRLSSPWGALQLATSVYHRQAVQCAAKCREKLGQSAISESVPGRGKVTVEISDLKGNILSFPDTDSNFPETWVQRSSRFQQLITEGAGNPWIGKLLSLPKNMKIAKDATGFTDLDVPEAESVDKQLGEFEILLKTGPVENPAIAQAKEQLTQHAQQAEQAGHTQQFEQMLPEAEKAISSLPPQASTVEVMQDASEDHSTEAQTCMEWLISAEGRKFKRGTPEEQAAWANVHLHWQEHTDMAQKLAPPPPTKPPSESMSAAIDKMPPELAAQLLGKYYGINATAQQFQVKQATDVEANITEKKAVPHATPTPPTVKQPSQENANGRS